DAVLSPARRPVHVAPGLKARAEPGKPPVPGQEAGDERGGRLAPCLPCVKPAPLHFHGRASRLTLPPLRTTATRFSPASARLSAPSSAASGTADDGSIRSFARSHARRIAATISSSLTVMTRPRCSRRTAQFNWPRLVIRPSATVFGGGCGVHVPDVSDRQASSASFGSPARTSRRGLTPCAATHS